jgi:Flp pilus assembly protein TadD
VLAGRRALRAAGAAALVAAAAGWLAHASVDWIWTFPVVGVPFFAVLGIAASSAGRPRLPTRGARVGAAAAVVVGLVLLVPPWLSGRLTDRVIAGRSADVAADADRAHLLDPLNTTAVVLQARVATTQEEAFARLRQAVGMAPRDYALRFALGSAYEQAGRIREARLELLTARALAPHDPFVLAAIERVGEQG